MPVTEHLMSAVATPVLADEVRRCHQKALRWLVQSGIRTSEGAYRSIYRPKTSEYVSWYGGETCLISTAGAVFALEDAGYEQLALQSAEHICELAIVRKNKFRGAIVSGKGSRFIFANWMASAILALLLAYRKSSREQFLDVAVSAVTFIVEKMQRSNGSIVQDLMIDGRVDSIRHFLFPRQLWLANCVEVFLKVYEMIGDNRFQVAAERFVSWLLQQQTADGFFPMYRHSVVSRILHGLCMGDFSEMAHGCRRTHPTAVVQSIRALFLAGKISQARRSSEWLKNRLGPNGLFYQYYFVNGIHSIEEDIMPTASFGLTLLEYPELGVDKELLRKIASGLCYAQVESADVRADGGMKGLPLDPVEGGDAYCFDTCYSIRFLKRLLERSSL